MKDNKFDKDGFSCHHTKRYLDLNRERGLGNGLTVKTYASRVTSLQYARYTAGRMYADMQSFNIAKLFPFQSDRGATAYYPIDMLTDEVKGRLRLFESLKRLDPSLTWVRFKKYY